MARPIRNSKLKTEIFFLIQNFRYNGVEISLRPVHSHLYRILHWWITSSHQRLINALIYQYGRSPHTPKCSITELIALVWPSSETPFMPKATKVASLSFLFESHFIFSFLDLPNFHFTGGSATIILFYEEQLIEDSFLLYTHFRRRGRKVLTIIFRE